jgi:hypothetical protein
MSMENIFRNLNDIRVFDIMVDIDKDNPIDTHEILDLLDYPYREIIQIQDSIDHLVKEKILSTKLVQEETHTGCEICVEGEPKLSGHEYHKPYKIELIGIEKYFFLYNNLTGLLVSAIFQSSMYCCEEHVDNVYIQ